jgi:hypothetical protein
MTNFVRYSVQMLLSALLINLCSGLYTFPSLTPSQLFYVSTALVGLDLLIVEVSRSHSHASHSAWLLWMSDQPYAEASTWQHTTLIRDRYPMPPAGFEPANPAIERPQTHTLDRAATEIGPFFISSTVFAICNVWFNIEKFWILATECVWISYDSHRKTVITFLNKIKPIFLCNGATVLFTVRQKQNLWILFR